MIIYLILKGNTGTGRPDLQGGGVANFGNAAAGAFNPNNGAGAAANAANSQYWNYYQQYYNGNPQQMQQWQK